VVPVERRDREEERAEYSGECERRLGVCEKFESVRKDFSRGGATALRNREGVAPLRETSSKTP
jgi:hypothetical protein